MDEILRKLSEHSGVSVEKTEVALGAILAFLREHLPEKSASRLMSALPEAHQMVEAHRAAAPAEPPGGLMGTLTGLATRLLGEDAGEATRLLAALHSSGLDLKQIEAFLPRVFELIKDHLPADLFEKIVAMIPAARKAT